MKTVGILLLFGLCTGIGLRLAEKRCEGIAAMQALERDVSAFAEAFDGGEGSLCTIAQAGDGALFLQLRVYLDALADGTPEADAAALAAGAFSPGMLRTAALRFFGGLSVCPRAQMRARIDGLGAALKEAEREAAPKRNQAKLLRAVGVLCGAALAVLLI